MITEKALVKNICGKTVVVEVDSSSVCSGCQANKVCGQGLMSQYQRDQSRQIELDIVDEMQLTQIKSGDDVLIGVEELSIIKASFYIYMLPLLMVMLALALAKFMGLENELMHMSLAFVVFAFGAVLSRFIVNLNASSGAIENTLLPVILCDRDR